MSKRQKHLSYFMNKKLLGTCCTSAYGTRSFILNLNWLAPLLQYYKFNLIVLQYSEIRDKNYKILMSDPGLQIIIRNCTDEVVDGSFCADTSAMGMTAKGCICNTDLCNNSRRFASFTELFMFLSIASLAFLLKYF